MDGGLWLVSLKWMHKDIGLALETGQELGVLLPLAALTEQMFRTAQVWGCGEEDFCCSIKVLEERAGFEVQGR